MTLERRTPLKRTAFRRPEKPREWRRRPNRNEIPAAIRDALSRRSGGVCEVAGCPVRAVHAHHRKLRRSKDHSLANLLHVCAPCHNYIHANPEWAYAEGYLIRQADPVDGG